jgi:choline dehydrogenase-like flavoprotein
VLYQTWQRGSAEDYDAWANEFGNGPGWTFKSLLPYFKKSENWSFPPLVLAEQENPPSLREAHGFGGPVQVHNLFESLIFLNTNPVYGSGHIQQLLSYIDSEVLHGC